jgi:cellulose synthase/poly-beta-1,6-N-acetylglucosamine synthase-like glycosyltransferase
VVEDLELTLFLAEANISIHYNPDAVITSDMAANRAQADSQRRRWEGGRLHLVRKAVPGLLKRTLKGEWQLLFLLMDLLIPPLSLLLALLAAFSLLGVWIMPAGLPLCGVLVLILVFYVVSGQIQRQLKLRHWGYLLGAPLFIAWKLLLYLDLLCKRRPADWVRTRRQHELSPDKNGADYDRP